MFQSLLNGLKRVIKIPLESRVGRLDARWAHRRDRENIPSVPDALATLVRRWPEVTGQEAAPTDSPVFILSAGWRSGSTLLQRLVMSGGEVLVWGEPYANCDYLGKFADSLRIFTGDYPVDEWFIDRGSPEDRERLSEKWIANLYPGVRDLLRAHRAFFDTLYGEPARRGGYGRWGFKEVRYGAAHAEYLRLLYPGARILFLYRNPYDAWRSYRIWRNWYLRWPDQPIFTARQFGRLWHELVAGSLAAAGPLNARVVRFEDLAGGRESLPDLRDYLDLKLDAAVLAQRVKGRGVPPDPIPAAELRLLRREVDPLAAELGYAPRSAKAGA